MLTADGKEWQSEGAGDGHLDELLLDPLTGLKSLVHAFSRCGESGLERFRPDPGFPDLDPKRGNSLGDIWMRLVKDDRDDFLEMGKSSTDFLSFLS